MDLNLVRTGYLASGVFSVLYADQAKLAVCLEHAYLATDRISYFAKIPKGVYLCQRGIHQLIGMAQPFETFEITGVPGHTNLLFHAGNFNRDSEGCILLGQDMAPAGSGEMITNSKATFATFMNLQTGIQNFQLTVS
jgi:hypothetical protein